MKTGFVGLIGMPNAGKTTLVNSLVGEKVGIVTPRPQTTRKRILGIYNDDQSQIAFVDCPGIVKAETGLNHFLQAEWSSVLEESDVIVAVLNLDASTFEELAEVMDIVGQSAKPKVAIITKTDLPQIHRLPKIEERLKELNIPNRTSSKTRTRAELIEDIVPLLRELLPESSEPLFDRELFTTQTMREITEEIILEKAFTYLHQEIPYGLAVKVRTFEEDNGPTVRINADLILAKENHKIMVIGKKGQCLKSIGTEARKELETMIGRKVYLELFVRVRKNWTREPLMMKEFGYVLER